MDRDPSLRVYFTPLFIEVLSNIMVRKSCTSTKTPTFPGPYGGFRWYRKKKKLYEIVSKGRCLVFRNIYLKPFLQILLIFI